VTIWQSVYRKSLVVYLKEVLKLRDNVFTIDPDENNCYTDVVKHLHLLVRFVVSFSISVNLSY
jgi:hypothetical protein